MSEPAYLATPVPTADRSAPWPGVVVVHDAFGLGNDMREQADWLAAAGYLTAIPDLYGGKRAVRCIKGAMAQLSAQQGPMYDQLDAARQWLAAQADCTGRVGVIGYCMGGGFALLLAGRPGWSAASVNYGQVPDNVASVLADACPLVASYGAKDRTLGDAFEKLQAAVPADLDADIKEYPDAGHSFLNRLAVASPLVPLMKISGVGYHHTSAADAKRRILTFCDTHLRHPA
jgi:carboxymethylenebutenolidase